MSLRSNPALYGYGLLNVSLNYFLSFVSQLRNLSDWTMAASGIAEHNEARRREIVYLRNAFIRKKQEEEVGAKASLFWNLQ